MRKIYSLLLAVLITSALYAHSDTAHFYFSINGLQKKVVFHNTSYYSDPNYRKSYWEFGDGKTLQTTHKEVSHHYATIGTYHVCLKIYKFLSPTDSVITAQVCKTISIGEECSASYSFRDSVLNNSVHRVQFAGTGYNNGGHPITRVCWVFGDGKDTCINITSTSAAARALYVRHYYPHNGSYNACIKITYAGGCSRYYCHSILLQGIIPPSADSCRAGFSVKTGTHPLVRLFEAEPFHNHGRHPKRICWAFGDGKDTCIVYPTGFSGHYSVEHLYAHSGNYNVCTKIEYDGGCQSYHCKALPVNVSTVMPGNCRADFTIEPSNATSVTKKFIALPWHNLHKRVTKVCWNFGDGKDTCILYPAGFSGPLSVLHTYTNSNVHIACVVIFYDGGCQSHECKQVPVPPADSTCKVHLYESASSSTSLERHLYATPLTNRTIARICWYFGDGKDTCYDLPNPITSQAFRISHVYSAPGTYNSCVKVYYSGGCMAQECKQVTILANHGACGAYMTDSLIGPKTIALKAFAIHPPNDHIISYRWSFGDGSIGQGEQVTHPFTNSGTYQVCLLTNTAMGCETKICKPFTILASIVSYLKISPNPVISMVHAVFLSTRQETVLISIYNGNGLQVRSYTRPAITGLNTWEFDMSPLPAGFYSITVHSPNQHASVIFFKQ